MRVRVDCGRAVSTHNLLIVYGVDFLIEIVDLVLCVPELGVMSPSLEGGMGQATHLDLPS